MRMLNTTALLTVPLYLLSLTNAAAQAQQETAENWRALIDEGRVGLSFRYRFEHVDDDNFDENANASTLRSRLSFDSGEYRDLSFFVEAEDVREILVNDFDAGAGNTPGRTEYPVVADPEGTEVNQAYLDYTGLSGTRLRLGRQRINLDNQRFVGGVGWRQNEQTYDALSVDWRSARGRVFYALVDNVNRVFGEDVPAGDHRQDPSHLLNAAVELDGLGRLSGYHYAIDNDDAPAFSTSTTGVRLEGSRDVRGYRTGYLAEYARQADAANNPDDYRADYWHLNGRLNFADVAQFGGVDTMTVGAGWEVLSGDAEDPGEAFRTPLATLHAFNGWADQFLTTPAAGLDDRYLKLTAGRGPWTLEARAHWFSAEDDGADYGQELDLRLGRQVNEYLQLDLFAAAFDGDEGFSDATKLWLMVTAQL